MTIQDFKKELNLITKSLENNFQNFYYDDTDNEDEIVLIYMFGSFRLRIYFSKDDIRCNILTFYFDIATSYTEVSYVSGQVFYGDFKKEILKVVSFFDSYIEFYN